jgi:hypothetical protein
MRSPDAVTRRTRDAANAAALAVVLFAMLWVLTTQVRAIRELSPFAEDPFDAVATYAVIFLPIVAGATWIRSLRHRGAVLAARTAARIRWGSAVAAGIVLAASVADAVAILGGGWPPEAGTIGAVVSGITSLVIVASAVALGLVVRAAAHERPTQADRADPAEPDLVDDGLALAVEVAARVRLGRPVERSAALIERFLDHSTVSPRRHPILFGVGLAVACGLALSLWHVIREGPAPSLVAPVLFTILGGGGVLVAYLATLRPLRLLRPPADP